MMQHAVTEFDLFTAPSTSPICVARPRDVVAVGGVVTALRLTDWAGTRALEATITDETGSLLVGFLGRTWVAGLDLGMRVVVGGRVLRHCGRELILNPYLWLTGIDEFDESDEKSDVEYAVSSFA